LQRQKRRCVCRDGMGGAAGGAVPPVWARARKCARGRECEQPLLSRILRFSRTFYVAHPGEVAWHTDSMRLDGRSGRCYALRSRGARARWWGEDAVWWRRAVHRPVGAWHDGTARLSIVHRRVGARGGGGAGASPARTAIASPITANGMRDCKTVN